MTTTHAHDWQVMSAPILTLGGHEVGFEVCSCYAVRGTCAGEEYVFPPIGVYMPVTLAALGTIIAAWAAAVLRRRGMA